MPGQQKRKRRRLEGSQRESAALQVPGHWELVFRTGDQDELRSEIRRLCAEHRVPDPAHLRIDMPCTRPVQPTTYLPSMFVPDADAES
jgi:hypothetical protein